MIDLLTDDTVLARFARDLDAAAPIAVPGSLDASDDDRAVARIAWAHRIVDEYRSVAVFGDSSSSPISRRPTPRCARCSA
jgi:hypothetical protein